MLTANKISLYTFLTGLRFFFFLFFINVSFSEAVGGDGIKFQVKSFLGVSTIQDFLLAVLNVFITVATPIIVIMIIYSGFLYVTARGNESQITKASTSMTYAIIGGILVIGAVALAGVINRLLVAVT